MRLVAILLLAAVAAAEGESRLGTLIRWYLNEKSPARQQEYLETIEAITGFEESDPKKSLAAVRAVAQAIRAGEHFRRGTTVAFAPPNGGAPAFHPNRRRIQPIADTAARYATVTVPAGYTPARAHPLVVDVGECSIAVPDGAIRLHVHRLAPAGRRTASREAWRVEALVLSLVAHVFEIAHVDPDRVVLRAENATTPLVWAIALHNPDRFAGVLSAQGHWHGGRTLAANAASFSGLVIEPRRGDPQTGAFLEELRRYSLAHVHLKPPPRGDATTLVPAIERWWARLARPDAPRRLELVADRNARVRSYWLRMAPRPRSQRTRPVGKRWTQKTLARPGTIKAEIHAENLVKVEIDRVVGFTIYVSEDLFDLEIPWVRLSLNGAPPESQLINFQIRTLLEDYRERRDPGLLYACALSWSIR